MLRVRTATPLHLFGWDVARAFDVPMGEFRRNQHRYERADDAGMTRYPAGPNGWVDTVYFFPRREFMIAFFAYERVGVMSAGVIRADFV